MPDQTTDVGYQALQDDPLGAGFSQPQRQISEGKPLTDRAYELLHIFLGVGILPGNGTNGEELAREAVRWCRALESEVATPTERPAPQLKRRPRSKRPAPPPLPSEFEEEDEEDEFDDQDWTRR